MKKILILNRRDIKNPAAGGAEIYTHEIFSRLSHKYSIVNFSCSFSGAPKSEYVDGIEYVRKGNELTMHIWAFFYGILNYKKFDLIIEQFNGVAMGLFWTKKSIVLIHQLYDDFWSAYYGQLFGNILKIFEKFLLHIYNKKGVITVSNSTCVDLLRFGFKSENISIVHNGVEALPDIQKYKKEKDNFSNIVMYLGRVVKTKNTNDAIRAFLKAKESISDLKLYVVGDGDQKEYLEKKYEGQKDITFFGFVSEVEKYRLLREASLLLVPSIREGWGQIVIQAASVATPVVGYDVAGIRDSVVDKKTGILKEFGDYKGLANTVVELLNKKELLKTISDNCFEHSSKFSWDKSAEFMDEAVVRFLKQINC